MTSPAQTSEVPQLDLNDGNRIPQLGLGVFQIPPDETAETVAHALSVGYRHADTAAAYQNESGVGEAIRQSDIDRGEVFVTTKLWNDSHARDEAMRAFEGSLRSLGFDYVDLYLIHWPAPTSGQYVEAWQTLTELAQERRARSIGVSNFEREHLERIIDETGVVPAVNQIEVHPHLQQRELRSFHGAQGIVTEAYSPLGQGASLHDPTIERIASAHDRTPAQIVLRWHVQLGNVVIPKTITPERIEENFRIFDFELSEEDMRSIAELDAGQRIGPDPATFVGA